jgi:hypothetical protein
VAGANYEVNIQLKADPALKSLERIEQKINKLTKTSVDLQDARGAAMVKNRNLADRINKLEEKGVKVAKMRERLNKAIEKTDKGSLQTAAAHEKILRREVKNEERLLQVKKEQLKVDRQQNRQKGPGRAQQAILGGGFPLLFGGSPFQAAAGALGGAFGGFAGGIGAQAAVGQIENLFAKAAELGQGLNSLTFDLEAVTGAAGFAGTETAQLLERIEQYGDATVAARLATELLERRIGVQGVKALKDFGDKAGELGRALSTIFTQVLAGIANAAGPLLSALSKFAGEQAAVGGFKARTDLTGADEFARQILTGEGLPQGPGARRAKILNRAKELGLGITSERQARKFARQRAISKQQAFEAPVLQEIEFEASQVQDPSQRRASRAAERAEARRQRLITASQKRIKLLEIESKSVEKITGFKDKIAAAELAGDKQTAARIEGEMRISELLAKQDQTIAKINPELDQQQRTKEVIAIQEKTNVDIAEVNAQTQRKIAKIISDDQLKALKEQEAFYKRIGEVINSGIVNGIQSAIDGSKSLGESLSGILKQLGGMFLKQAIGTFSTSTTPGTGLFGALGFASGGFVSGATPAVVGEAGPEYIIPESKMRSAMSRYSRGARGSAVIPEGGGGGTSGEGGGTAVAAPIDVRFNVERINNVDYVTAEQFQVGLARAAQQGAAEGERRAMGSLRNSAAVRRRIGV